MATFDYTSRDYLSIRQDLINRAARTIPEWDGTDASEFGNVFVDLWAYMGDVLHFYIDRAASETFLDTATQRESVLAIANLLDYIPASSRAARGTISLKLTAFPPANIKNKVISSATVAGSTITFTTSTNHDLTSGQLITVSGMSPTVFNISDVVVSSIPTPTTFTLTASKYTDKGQTAPTTPSTTGTTGTLFYNVSYILPQYTTFTAYDTNGDSIDFYLPSSATFTQVNETLTTTIIQGTITSNESLGLSNGRPNQAFTLTKGNVDTDSITIQVYEGPLVGGSPSAVSYQYVAQLSTANYLDKVFTTKITSDNYTQIVFGNSFNGVVPSTNSVIIGSYRTTVGSSGNLPVNKVQLINGTSSSYVAIQSSGSSVGGANQEPIESIKSNVSRLYRTQDRAVSLQDYKDLTLQLPGVSKATAIYGDANQLTVGGSNMGADVYYTTTLPHGFVVGQRVTITGGSGSSSLRGTNLPIQSVIDSTNFSINAESFPATPTGTLADATVTATSTVVLYPVPHQSVYPPEPVISLGAQKVVLEIPTPMVESINNYFVTRSMLGVTAEVIDPTTFSTFAKYIECTPVYVGMKVYVKNNYVQSWIKDAVDIEVRNLLSFENVYFGQTLTMGEVYRAALNVTGVDYVELTNLSTVYDATPDTIGVSPANVTALSTKILCFTDKITVPSLAPTAINLAMYGGITGSN